MIFFGGLVIGLPGLNLAIEIANIFHFAVKPYLHCPSLSVFVPAYPLKSRIALPLAPLPPVPAVLCTRCRPKVRLSIIKPVMIDMVNQLSIRYLQNLPVHHDRHPLISDVNPSLRIERMFHVDGVPFVLA